MATITSKDLQRSSTLSKFRVERFTDKSRSTLSLMKIGEYVRTPLFEPSIRAMRTSLSDVRKQLAQDRKRNERFNIAWEEAKRLYGMKSSYLKQRFKGPEEYCIALICFTLDEPYRVYSDFNKKCQDLVTTTLADFPYKSLLYLLIQAEMRLTVNYDEIDRGVIGASVKYPGIIGAKTDLEYIVEEEAGDHGKRDGEEDHSESGRRQCSSSTPKKKSQQQHRVYRAFEFGVDEMEFQPRNLVAFNQLIPATKDGQRLVKALAEKQGKGKVTLLEIDQVSWSSRQIAALSAFPVEKEVIIWPWIKFYVEERTMIGENVEKIVLKPTSQSFMGTEGIL